MSSWLSFVIVALAAIYIAEGRAVPAKPVSVMTDTYGNPMVFIRDKRAPIGYPHRTMMFTGYYRPVRRTNDGQQATGVFAQGNAVSGNSYVVDGQPDYLQRGPEPIDEAAVTSSQAEAAPNPLEHHIDEEQQREKYTPQNEQPEHEESHAIQEQDQESSDSPTEGPSAEEHTVQPVKAPSRPAKRVGSKKTKKRPAVIESEESEDSEDEDQDDDENDEDDDEPAVPFVPFKSNRRRNNAPNLNNFFPMVFSYPRGGSRGGSSEIDGPGMITAIANSYSTAKGGVASSVATAYGGSPQGKKHRRAQPVQE